MLLTNWLHTFVRIYPLRPPRPHIWCKCTYYCHTSKFNQDGKKTNVWDNGKCISSMGQCGGAFNRRVHSALLPVSNNGWSRPLHQSQRSLPLLLWHPVYYWYKTKWECSMRAANYWTSSALNSVEDRTQALCDAVMHYKLFGYLLIRLYTLFYTVYT